MTENPERCEICLAKWDFATTWLGEVRAIHPITACVPPVYAHEVDDLDEPITSHERRCVECKELFKPQSKQSNATICGSDCRKARRDRKKQESDAKRGKWWALKIMARLDLPTRECIECNRLFTMTSKYSAKQKLCSAKCRTNRLNRQAKERRAA